MESVNSPLLHLVLKYFPLMMRKHILEVVLSNVVLEGIIHQCSAKSIKVASLILYGVKKEVGGGAERNVKNTREEEKKRKVR